ncbi:hypothetical protein A8C56_17045 [Niabella ginsenosidivorans]|uniref:Uncharacterized protein n=1 Tax=Niabella ginsenosidivorans TaxID=1176587 RepID=A0A1A9I494_9BACT|nr:hypothetical protein A8C56_17045 [Niabella ginsenosidivorans]
MQQLRLMESVINTVNSQCHPEIIIKAFAFMPACGGRLLKLSYRQLFQFLILPLFCLPQKVEQKKGSRKLTQAISGGNYHRLPGK